MPADLDHPRALLINGTVGSGKTTTADAIGTQLRDRGVPHAVIDLDWLRNAWPAPVGDPFNDLIGLRNLESMITNFRSAGIQRFVLAGVLESTDWRQRYVTALGVPLTVVRLVVELPALRRRLLARHPPGGDRDWHLHRSVELNAILEQAAVDDLIIDVGAAGAATVAMRVSDAVGWS